jgi:hypothetical protein
MEGGRRVSWLNLPERESVPPTSAEPIGAGPGPCRLPLWVRPSRLLRSAIVLKASTCSASHQAMCRRKYPMLFSPNRRRKPGPKGPSAELVHAVVEMKQRNPRWGCPRIAQQIALAFNLPFDKDVVRRILAHHYLPEPASGGPSSGVWICSAVSRPR